MLAIAAKGYAGVWVDGQMKLNHTGDKIAELIHLEKGFTVRAVIPVGRPVKDVRQKEKMSFRERARFIE